MTDISEKKRSALLISVGGSAAPVLHSLNEQRPDYICFFCSHETRDTIESEILSSLDYRPVHHDWIETEDSQCLSSCYRAVRDELPRVLKKWRLTWDELTVDFTGGTKVMSSACLLATIRYVSRYTYVGAESREGRNRAGTGVVINGCERLLREANPWKDMAEEEHRELALLFNRAQFSAALEVVSRLSELVPEDIKPVYSTALKAIEGYDAWDRFEHKKAYNSFKQLRGLGIYAIRRSGSGILAQLVQNLDSNLSHLEKLVALRRAESAWRRTSSPDLVSHHRHDVIDVIANAKRRAEMEQQWDDAVARLYSAIEANARYRLLDEHGIDTAHAKAEQIPNSLRKEYVRRYGGSGEDRSLRFGLQAAYCLLAKLGDEVGRRYEEVSKELESALQARNQSRLAHGTAPVRKEVYEKLYQLALRLAGVEEDELPVFPHLDPERR